MNQIIEWRGKPLAIRFDNGPEYISSTLMIWAEKQGIALKHIQPGKPQQNAYVERYNRTVRHEWLGLYIFEVIEEVQEIATDWPWTGSNERSNMGSDGMHARDKCIWLPEAYFRATLKRGGLPSRRTLLHKSLWSRIHNANP